MTTSVKPLIAITMGDAAGIGPEIIVKTLGLEEIYRICRPTPVVEMHHTLRFSGGVGHE
jgi:4-hydroxythreonine-4-phosphate dehydrogenase